VRRKFALWRPHPKKRGVLSSGLAEERITISINGTPHDVRAGVTVFAALQLAGITVCRRSVTGEPRSGICGMGVCFECRVGIDGIAHQRACMVLCRPRMEIVTDA